MNYSSLRTAADIMDAFQKCQNAGERIDLFEALATSDEPPVEAFVEILRNVKLEAVIALTIQAFGKITDADIGERLKQSDDLLAILSEQAQSGRTDLIRWSAATTIVNIGFDFIAVSQHLTVEPKSIADRIMQAKLRRLEDKNLLSSNDFDEYLNFWVYGNLDALKIQTASMSYEQDSKYEELINKIFRVLVLRAIKDVNKALERAESMGSSALEVDENELFELAACQEAINQIKNKSINSDDLIASFVHCLQSRNREIRNIATHNLSEIDKSLLGSFNQYYQPSLLTAISLIQEEVNANNSSKSYYDGKSYNNLKFIANNLITLLTTLGRTRVKDDCNNFLNNLRNEITKRKNMCENKYKQIQNMKSTLDRKINEIEAINTSVYTKVISKNNFQTVPYINIEENEEYNSILDDYLNSLRDELSRLRREVNKFYEEQLAPIEKSIKNRDKFLKELESSQTIFLIVSYMIAFFIISIANNNTGWIIFGTIVIGYIFSIISKMLIKIVCNIIRKFQSNKYSEQNSIHDQKNKILNLLSI
jgi:archaellum component FlaC